MTLNILDISSFQNPDAVLTPGTDGVIIKATQGTSYVNPKCNAQVDAALKANKLVGLYHYASTVNPIAEAQYFLSNIKGYLGKGFVLALDWESGQNSAWGQTNWAKQFVDHIHSQTGVWPLVYTNGSGLPMVANTKDTCGLWFAGYPDLRDSWTPPSFPYSIAPWNAYTLWQFTDSNGKLDRSVANLDKAGWAAIAKGSGKTSPVTPTNPNPVAYNPSGKSIDKVASDVKDGLAGNGDVRKNLLGAYYVGVQAVLSMDSNNANKTLAKETLAGVYGNGDTRKTILGGHYNAVQDIINGSAVRYYTVQSGESLSSIGAKLGVTWQTVAAKNNIGAPHTIFPGQKL